MSRRTEPFLTHRCRHAKAGNVLTKHTRTCAVGLDPEAVATILTPAQRVALDYMLPRGWPCTLGQREGLSCAGYEPWTPEEIAADEQQTKALIAAVSRDTCTCGAALKWRGNFFCCSTPCATPVSGHSCR